MTQLKLIVNYLPRDLAEFSLFLIIGFTAGSIGLIWFNYSKYLVTKYRKINRSFKMFCSFALSLL